MIQTKHTPDITTSNTYSIFQWYWLNYRPVAYYQIDYPAATTTRRFLESDEQNRPLAVWDWPTSGSATRVWEVDPGLFGWDEVTVGANIYQPIRFPGQLYDEDTEAWADDSGATLKRPGICYNRYRSYDSFTGGYLQSDPLVADTWDAYGYVEGNPVMKTDPTGLCSSEACFNLASALMVACDEAVSAGCNFKESDFRYRLYVEYVSAILAAFAGAWEENNCDEECGFGMRQACSAVVDPRLLSDSAESALDMPGQHIGERGKHRAVGTPTSLTDEDTGQTRRPLRLDR